MPFPLQTTFKYSLPSSFPSFVVATDRWQRCLATRKHFSVCVRDTKRVSCCGALHRTRPRKKQDTATTT
ncbi:hypothetical protein SRHO_G00035330 [Serrasalmus rhombeus]